MSVLNSSGALEGIQNKQKTTHAKKKKKIEYTQASSKLFFLLGRSQASFEFTASS
jgi:hypothetical protein